MSALRRLSTTLFARRALSTSTSGKPLLYTEKMDLTGRPVSPHVTIYAFPTIAITSIAVRITGVCLTIGTTGVATMALLGGNDAPSNFASSIASSSAAPLAKFAVGFSCVYHYLGACRHTFWDKTIKGFTNAQMLQSSYALLVRGLRPTPTSPARPVLRRCPSILSLTTRASALLTCAQAISGLVSVGLAMTSLPPKREEKK